ncbi:hypothetical protein AB0I28_33420 [Phytomonospora sp. NPDC050363]|uniref:hypothetical protein n=1 Tax=Phytomonospora sp. NPDC050363 TaxID=3155642 RepID=UPI0033E81EC3
MDLGAVNWLTLCGGNQGTGQAESCAMLAEIPDSGGYAIADNKQPGVDLRFTPDETRRLRDELNNLDLAA